VTQLHPWQAGYAVRRDWPDGTHELVGFQAAPVEAARFLQRDRWYWRRGPLRPRAWDVVLVSRRDFELHAVRHDCRSPDCPRSFTPEPDRLPRSTGEFVESGE